MDIKKELSKNQIILLLMPSMDYNELTLDIARQLSAKSICYVTLNKTYTAIDDKLKKEGVNTKNIFYIDAISKTIKKTPDRTDRCYFVSSPMALTELCLVSSKCLRSKSALFPKAGSGAFDYLLFDSLTNLLVYEKKAPVGKFMASLVNKIRDSKTGAVFYALKMEQHSELIQESSMFVDKVIDLTEEQPKSKKRPASKEQSKPEAQPNQEAQPKPE